MRFILIGSFLLLAVAPGTASAQGVFNMGTLTDTLSTPAAPANGAAGATPAPAPTAKVPETALRYKPSLELRKRNYAQFVEKLRPTSPEGAAQLEKLFAQQDVIEAMGKGLATYGLRTDDMADAFTVYWFNAWQASRGIATEGSKEQAAAVRRQAVSAMSATPNVATLTDAQKQEFSEALLIQAMMLDAAVKAAQNNPQQLEQVKAGARQGAKAMGLDLDQIELTPNGFVRAGAAAPAQ